MKQVGPILGSWLEDRKAPEIYHEKLLPVFWDRIMGDKLAMVTMPGPLTDGQVTVFVKNRYWKDHLAGMEETVRQKIANYFPKDMVRGVTFTSSPSRFPQNAALKVPDREPARHQLEWAVRCSNKIDSPRLRDLIQQVIIAHSQLKNKD